MDYDKVLPKITAETVSSNGLQFSMCEYAIVITNIGYHLTSYLDFYTLVLRV
jgi:hypothetical protein